MVGMNLTEKQLLRRAKSTVIKHTIEVQNALLFAERTRKRDERAIEEARNENDKLRKQVSVLGETLRRSDESTALLRDLVGLLRGQEVAAKTDAKNLFGLVAEPYPYPR